MKRTLKRGSKVREIAKREAIGLSMDAPLNRISWGYKGGMERAGLHLVHPFLMKLPSVSYFWGALVSIGSLESAAEELEHGRPS